MGRERAVKRQGRPKGLSLEKLANIERNTARETMSRSKGSRNLSACVDLINSLLGLHKVRYSEYHLCQPGKKIRNGLKALGYLLVELCGANDKSAGENTPLCRALLNSAYVGTHLVSNLPVELLIFTPSVPLTPSLCNTLPACSVK